MVEAEHETALWSEYRQGEENIGKSPPVEYWAAGELAFAPEVGKHVAIHREVRNGVRVDGVMRTSTVLGIAHAPENDELILTTRNSVYVLEPWDGVVTAEGGA